MTPKRKLLRVWLPVGFGLLLLLVWLLRTPRQPLADVQSFQLLSVRRGTVSTHSGTMGEDADAGTPTGLPDAVTDLTDRVDLELLAANLRLLRTDRLPTLNSLFGTESFAVDEIEYEITGVCDDGRSFHLTVGSRAPGRFQLDGNAVYRIRDSEAWFALLEAMGG